MQAQETFGAARRALDVEDYIDIARRHRGWIFGPLFAGLVISVVSAYLWPDTYVSSSVIKVVPQQVPESLVQSNVNQLMSDRIIGMAQEVLSRETLTSIIKSRELYPREQSRLPLEDVVEMMRKKIIISPVQNVMGGSQSRTVPAFSVQFSYTDRTKARDVVQDLTGRLITENLRQREDSSEGTTRMLKDEWERAKAVLNNLDNKLAEFRARNQGRLPDEVNTNIQQMNALQSRISNLNQSITQANSERLMLETQLKNIKDQYAAVSKESPPDPVTTAMKSEHLAELDRSIRSLENQLIVLREQYKESYPDVQNTVRLLNSAKKEREQVLKEEEAKKSDTPAVARMNPQMVREQRSLEQQMNTYQSAIAAKDNEIESYKKDQQGVYQAIKGYQSRLEAAPASEREYGELVRDEALAQQKFLEADAKMSKSSMAEEMEKRKYGENLELLDPALLPQTPSEPKRPVIIGIGSAIGLFVGILLAGAREMKDTSLKNLKDVRAYTQLQILGSVPLLENDLVVKRRKRIAWLGWSLALLMGVVVMSGSIIYYYVTTAHPAA